MTCLPDELDTDAVCDYLKRKRPRVWVLLREIELQLQTHVAADVARWTLAVWAHRLGVRSVRQLEKDLAEMRGLGVIDPDTIRTSYYRASEPTANTPRQRFPSDERRRSASTPQTYANDSAGTPQEGFSDSVSTPQADDIAIAIAKAEAIREDISSQAKAEAEAKPGAPANVPAPSASIFPNRMQPNAEEICKLELKGWTPSQIEQATTTLAARKNFKGSARWDHYLQPVLLDLFGHPAQERMTLPQVVSGGTPKPPPVARPEESQAGGSGKSLAERCHARANEAPTVAAPVKVTSARKLTPTEAEMRRRQAEIDSFCAQAGAA